MNEVETLTAVIVVMAMCWFASIAMGFLYHMYYDITSEPAAPQTTIRPPAHTTIRTPMQTTTRPPEHIESAVSGAVVIGAGLTSFMDDGGLDRITRM